ncbi:MAG: hypothetical protein ACU84Q_21820 [Gammaproteobacteria bacterium]
MLTQLSRSSEARKVELRDLSMTVTPRFEQTGSIGADTVQSRLVDVATALYIDSPAPRDKIAKLVATAERMCFLMDTIREPHEVRNSVSLNGEPL